MSWNTQLAGWIKLTGDVESLQSTQAGNARYDPLPDKAILKLQFNGRRHAPGRNFDKKSSRQPQAA